MMSCTAIDTSKASKIQADTFAAKRFQEPLKGAEEHLLQHVNVQEGRWEEVLNNVLTALAGQRAALQHVVEQQTAQHRDMQTLVQQNQTLIEKMDTAIGKALHSHSTHFRGSSSEDAASKIADLSRTHIVEPTAMTTMPPSPEGSPESSPRVNNTMSKEKTLAELGRQVLAEKPVVLDQSCSGRMKRFLQSMWCDMCTGVVIVLNLGVMTLQLQFAGMEASYVAGARQIDPGNASESVIFDVLELAFNAYYTLDLILHICFLGWSYIREPINILDAIVVFFCGLESFLLRPLGLFSMQGLGVMRLIRVARILRIVKVIKFMRQFTELRVLLKSLSLTGDSLVWGVCLLSVSILGCAMLLVITLKDFITDPAADMEVKLWVLDRFGTPTQACYTLFEAAMTGTWTLSARPLITEVSPLFAVFWYVFVIVVNFAITRVIAAMFLKQTMAVAAADAEKVAFERMKKKETFAYKLKTIFEVADTTGDGVIDADEFLEMMNDSNVMEGFRAMDLEVDEVATLFKIIADDDGEADYQEFLDGAMKMKSTARTIDAIQILHEQSKTQKLVECVLQHLESTTGNKRHTRKSISPAVLTATP